MPKRSYETRSKAAPKEEVSHKKTKSSKDEIETKKKEKHEEAHEGLEVMESGNIYFFYRKKVDTKKAFSLDDVQKLYVLLWPKMDKDHHKHPLRLITLSKKKLPEISKHGKYWAFITKVAPSVSDIHKDLDPFNYVTKTLGERHIEGAVPIGEGVYDIINSKKHTHLAYVLHMPHDIGPVQKAFNIEPEGSYVISVKNPKGAASFMSKGRSQAEYPKELQDVFENRKWNKACPITLLDRENVELLIIGASKDLAEEMKQIGDEMEELLTKAHSSRLSDEKLFKDLNMRKADHPPQSLLKGSWK